MSEQYRNLDQSINLDDIKKSFESRRAIPTPSADIEESVTVGGDFANRLMGEKVESNVVAHHAPTDYEATSYAYTSTETIHNPDIQTYVGDPYMGNTNGVAITPAEHSSYNGPGLVIKNDELIKKKEQLPKYTGVTPDTQSSIDKYMAEFDADIEMMREQNEELKEELGIEDEDDETPEEDPGMTKDEFQEKYNQAVVIIDKTGFGKVINFTEEEHEKLEKAKKIKLEEVETISLDTIKTKKPKKKDIDKIIKRVTSITTTNIVLPLSGYTAEVKGCSAYELISLIDQNENALLNAQNKWSLIHSKLENTSLGKMDFNEFLMNTAASDYNTFIYGLLCSTYPDDDKMPLTCTKCKKPFDHSYSVRSLIRAEAMSDQLKDTFMEIVDNSVTEASAKEVHDKALISSVKRIRLPQSGIIAEIYVQSAYDLINKSIKDLNDNTDEKYTQTAVLSTLINTFYVPDPDEPGSYFEVTNGADISKTLYTLNEIDVLIIRKMGEELLDGMNISYGLMDITCPHCGNYIPFIELELENILFYRYRQALNTVIE